MQHFRFKFQVLLLILCALSACRALDTEQNLNLSANQLFDIAEKQIKKENYAQAIKHLEAIEARFPYTPWAIKAQLELAYAYYRKKDAPNALAAADRFTRMHPSHPKVDFAYYLKGLVNYEQNLSPMYQYLPVDRALRDPKAATEAFEDFKLLVERFPKSQYSADARQKMVYLRNQLGMHELHIAEYYLYRGANLSAINRLNYIITHFDRTSSLMPALVKLKEVYQKMGMHALAKKTEVLIQELKT